MWRVVEQNCHWRRELTWTISFRKMKCTFFWEGKDILLTESMKCVPINPKPKTWHAEYEYCFASWQWKQNLKEQIKLTNWSDHLVGNKLIIHHTTAYFLHAVIKRIRCLFFNLTELLGRQLHNKADDVKTTVLQWLSSQAEGFEKLVYGMASVSSWWTYVEKLC